MIATHFVEWNPHARFVIVLVLIRTWLIDYRWHDESYSLNWYDGTTCTPSIFYFPRPLILQVHFRVYVEVLNKH